MSQPATYTCHHCGREIPLTEGFYLLPAPGANPMDDSYRVCGACADRLGPRPETTHGSAAAVVGAVQPQEGPR